LERVSKGFLADSASVYGTYEDELVVFSVEVIKVVSPQILGIPRVHETVAIW
jgi:hypothetical protein